MPKIICLMGITCSGKDTLAERMAERWPDDVGLIQVGKEFRKRYPPEYFQGKGATSLTEVESWQIFDEQLVASVDKKIVVVVGQPRLVVQLHEMRKRDKCVSYYLLDVDTLTLQNRIDKRFSTGSEGWRTLALQRVVNDKVQLYELLVEMKKYDIEITDVFNTEECLDTVASLLYQRHRNF